MAPRAARLALAVAALTLVAGASAKLPLPANSSVPEEQTHQSAKDARTFWTSIDNPLAVANGFVRQLAVNKTAAIEKVLTRIAEQLEGPVRNKTKPVYNMGTEFVRYVLSVIDGPMYNISGPIRNWVGDQIMRKAAYLEGPTFQAGTMVLPEQPDPASDFVTPWANVVGRLSWQPGLGRLVGIAVFGLIPKPPQRKPDEPRRPYDPVYPTDAYVDPELKPSGECKAFDPASMGKRNILDVCKEMRSKPRSFYDKMWNATVPTKGTPFPVNGCVFGCAIGNDPYTDIQHETAIAMGWSGKCFSQQKDADGVPKRFGTLLEHSYWIPNGHSQKERVGYYNGIGDFIFNGQGRWADRSLSDGKPTWRYQDDRPSIEMFTAGGWRTMYSLAQAVADGVSDEFRDQGNGMVLGKSFYRPPIWRGRTTADATYFMLFQACTADGKVPWKPEQREVPQIADP